MNRSNINIIDLFVSSCFFQIEFEGSKHEIRHMQEEVEVLNQQVMEQTSLKKIAEKQLEESLESLQAEREQRYNLKKEMDMKMNSENMIQMGNLMRGLGGDLPTKVGGDESMEHMDEDQRSSGPTSDLFSEIHSNELQKLEKQLEFIENEKLQLTQNLHETKDSLDRMKNDLASQITYISQLKFHTESLDRLQTEADQQNNNLDNRKLEVTKIKVCVQEMEEAVKSASSVVASGAGDTSVDVMVKLKTDMISLRGDISTAEQKSSDMQHDMRILEKLSSDSLRALTASQREVFSVQQDIAKMYERVCEANHTTPHKIMTLDHVKSVKDTSSDGTEKQGEDQSDNERKNSSNTSTMISKLKSSNTRSHFNDVDNNACDPAAVQNKIETIKDQLKYLCDAIEKHISVSRKREVAVAAAESAAMAGRPEAAPTAHQLEEATDQIIKLKSLLSTKREQIATLRTVLKANKQTAEVALANLKSKYDNEKHVVSETMMKLRNELRILKEDAATFCR
jgi:protein bicaudal D